MENSGELPNSDSIGDNKEPVHSPILRNPDRLFKVDWSPIEKLNKKYPLLVPRIVKIGLNLLFICSRIGTFSSATLFCVILPLVPTVLYVVKNGSIARETLIITGIMQVLSFLNAEYKSGGMAVFVAYIIGFGFCAYVQDWRLDPVVSFKTVDQFVHYTFHGRLINGHLLDSFLLVGIMFVCVLNCISVFKTYFLGFEKHWFWEDLMALRKKKEQPKAIEENHS